MLNEETGIEDNTGLFLCVPGKRTFLWVKVPNPLGSGKESLSQGFSREAGLKEDGWHNLWSDVQKSLNRR